MTDKKIYDWVIESKGKLMTLDIPDEVKNNPKANINSEDGQVYARRSRWLLEAIKDKDEKTINSILTTYRFNSCPFC